MPMKTTVDESHAAVGSMTMHDDWDDRSLGTTKQLKTRNRKKLKAGLGHRLPSSRSLQIFNFQFLI
jgi:hypothetical protein